MVDNRYLRSTLRRSHWRFYLRDLCGISWLQDDEWLPIAPGLLNCMRARSWMERLMQAMENVNGYTVSGLMRDRIAHASETRWLRMEPMPETYRAQVRAFTGILGELDAQVLRRHPERCSVTLMDREERRRWDEARAALMALLLDRHTLFTEEELSALTECPRALIPWERLWHDD